MGRLLSSSNSKFHLPAILYWKGWLNHGSSGTPGKNPMAAAYLKFLE